MMAKEQENEVFDLIGRLIQTLSSPDIAIDDRHTPKLYARFLAGLLSRHRRDGATVGRLHPQPPPQQQVSHSSPGDFGHNQSSSSTSSFPMMPMQGGQSSQGGYSQSTYTNSTEKAGTPIYRPEATYALGNGPIQFSGDLDMGVNGFSDEEMLATMQALKNPLWWQNMMMPGYACSLRLGLLLIPITLITDSPGQSPSRPSRATHPLLLTNNPKM